MQNPEWIGSHGVNRALRFDNVWSSLDIFKGNDTDIYFAAKTSGPDVILDEFGFQLSNVDLTGARVVFALVDPETNKVILTKNSGTDGGIVLTDPTNGKLIISLAKEDFTQIDSGIYSCEIAFQGMDQKIHTLAKCVLNLIHSIIEGIAW